MSNQREIHVSAHDPDPFLDPGPDPDDTEWIDPESINELTMQLVYAGKIGDTIFYDLLDDDKDLLAEASLDEIDVSTVLASIHFLTHPSLHLQKNAIRYLAAEALSKGFDQVEVSMNYEGEAIGELHIERG